MKTARKLLAIVGASLALSACTTALQLRPLDSGEARLTKMQMPEVVREDIPYDIVLDITSDGKPEIRKICFRWMAEPISSGSPSLYSYATAPGNTTGPTTATWATPEVTAISEYFCISGEDIKTNVPGKLVVRIRPANLKLNYNKLEGQAEYMSEGRVRTTNKVSTHIMVDQ